MPQKLFKNAHVQTKGKFTIIPPDFLSIDDIKAQEDIGEEYKGPSIEEVEAEISRKRSDASEEVRSMRKKSEEESRRIIELAESGAFQRIKAANDDHKRITEAAQREAEEIVHKAQRQAEEIIKVAEDKKTEINKAAFSEGYEEGISKAFDHGKTEVASVIGRLEKILGETINKRNEIIESSEKQLSNIAIIIARKVVKAITESDQAVILRNVSESLRKVKGRAQVTIRVNISDLELTARHKDDFYRMLDNIENVNVLEDPNIEKGGCIIETDFGDIDARISAQLDEIETAIKNIQPIKDLS